MSATMEAAEAYDEGLDEAYDEAWDEGYEEARPPPRGGMPLPRPVPTAGRGSAYRPRPAPGATQAPVTQAQLQAALARVSSQMGTNSKAITTLDGRVRSVTAEQTRLTAAMRKESADRKKDIDKLRGDLQSTTQLIALISLLFPAGSPGAGIAPLVFLLPPDFLNGITGGGSSSGSATGSNQSAFGGSGLVALVAVAAASGLLK